MKLDPEAVITMLPPPGFLRIWWMPNLTVYRQPMRLTLIVLRFGGSKSPFESTSSSSSEIVGAIPALAKTCSIFPYCFSAALNLLGVSCEEVPSIPQCSQVDLLLPICYIDL